MKEFEVTEDFYLAYEVLDGHFGENAIKAAYELGFQDGAVFNSSVKIKEEVNE